MGNYNLEKMAALDDDALMASLSTLVAKKRLLTAELLAHLGEVDSRKLYLEQACSSLFTYCVQRLGFAEGEAYKRISAARLARKFPHLYEQVEKGLLNVTTLSILAAHATPENQESLWAQAAGKSCRQVEELVARLFPKPEVRTFLRKLPQKIAVEEQQSVMAAKQSWTSSEKTCERVQASGTESSTQHQSIQDQDQAPFQQQSQRQVGVQALGIESRVQQQNLPCPDQVAMPTQPQSISRVMAPLSAERYRLQLNLSSSTKDKLLQAQALLRHSIPDGDLEKVLDRALDFLCEQLQAKQFAKLKGKAKKTGRREARAAEVASRKDEACSQEQTDFDAKSSSKATTGFKEKTDPEAKGSFEEETTFESNAGFEKESNSQGETGREDKAASDRELSARRVDLTRGNSGVAAGGVITGKERRAKERERRKRDDEVMDNEEARPETDVKPQGCLSQQTATKKDKASRYIPCSVRREVAERDGLQCSYTDKTGRRCGEKGFLQMHHRQAFAKG